jgi:hypothetical protein
MFDGPDAGNHLRHEVVMNLRTLLSVYAVLIGVGGLIFLLLPEQNLAVYGFTSVGALAVVLSRFAGAMGIALGVIAWRARAAGASPERDAIVLGIIVANALSAIVTLFGALSGAFNRAAWVPVVSYTVFTALFVVAARPRLPQKQPAAV